MQVLSSKNIRELKRTSEKEMMLSSYKTSLNKISKIIYSVMCVFNKQPYYFFAFIFVTLFSAKDKRLPRLTATFVEGSFVLLNT